MMDENSLLAEPKDAREVTMEAMVVSALNSAALAEKYGLRSDQIILSAKVSGVQDLIDVYRSLAARCNLSVAPRTHRSRHGRQRHRGLDRGAGRAVAGRHRRHHPRLAHTRSGWRSHRRSPRRAADSAVARHSQLHSASHRVSRLRTHHQHVLPGNGGADSVIPARADADRGKDATPASKR